MIEPGSEAFDALYCDDTHQPIGLDEVQLLETISPGRRVIVRRLAGSDDEFERYQAALLLIAWGDVQALAAAERLIAEAPTRTVALAPYRLGGNDMAYDELAEALTVAVTVDRATVEAFGPAQIRRLAKDLLRLVPDEDFRSGLRALLLECSEFGLVDDMMAAAGRAIAVGRTGLASELLEPIAVADPDRFWSVLDRMVDGATVPADVEANLCDALTHVPGPRSHQLLDNLLQSERPGVARAASAARRHQQGDDDANRR